MKKSFTRIFSLILCAVLLLCTVSCEHEHVFGEWTTDSEIHSRACTQKNCEYAETGFHTFDGGIATTPATTEAPGVLTYTCTECGYSYEEKIDQLFEITLTEIETWDIHTTLQKKYLADLPESATDYAVGNAELSYPAARTFAWTAAGFTDERVLDHYEISFSEYEDFSVCETYTSRWNDFSKANGGQNLKVRTTYYWKVKTVLQNGETFESKVSSFTTLEGPRNLYVDGVANFRDLGGKDCKDGVLRQGLIYRCGRLHDNYGTTQKVSGMGIKTLKALGIKSEIDLRGKIKDGVVENGDKADGSFKVTKSVIGDDVNYFHPGAEYSDTMLQTEVGRTMVKGTFDVLANKDNYPLLFHCSIGTDRTGIIAILTEGVCGVDENVILQDYLFSNFGNIGSSRLKSRYDIVVSAIKSCKGSNFMEKCENYLLKCGVTAEQIQTVRDILIEKK